MQIDNIADFYLYQSRLAAAAHRRQKIKSFYLLSPDSANTKLRKSENAEYLLFSLSLAPSDASGFEVCPFKSPACAADCVGSASAGLASVFPGIMKGRIEKTRLFFSHRSDFLYLLHADLIKARAKASKAGKRAAIRLNTFSDLAWERIDSALFAHNPEISFYDYTKASNRSGLLLPNYWLTLSRSELNTVDCISALQRGSNVAVVFDRAKLGYRGLSCPLPKTWKGFKVIDGDKTDLRISDPRGKKRGYVIGLRAKSASAAGLSRLRQSGFVEINRAIRQSV